MNWIRRMFSRSWRYEELSESIREHLDEKIADLIDRGMTRDEAERTARREFGNVTRIEERSREVWQWPTLESTWADVQFALRQLRKSPGFTTVALLTLALGIGANTAIFSVVNSVLLRPLPFYDPSRLMMLDEKWLPRFSHFEAPPQDFLAWREQSKSFDQLGAFVNMAFNLSEGDTSERISGERVTANLPDLLGVKPILGRTFTPQEDTAGNDHVILLGYSLWKRQFSGSANVLGSTVKLNDVDFTVVGVMPPSFRFPHDAEIWKPMGLRAEDLDGGHFLWGIGRLKQNATPEQAQAEMDAIMPRLRTPQFWSVNVFPLINYYTGDLKTPLYVLLGATGLVLLIACVNVAGLLLARGSAREPEIAISKCPLVSIPEFDQIAVDHTVLLFTILLTTITGLLFGSLPAIRLASTNLLGPLKSGSKASAGGKRTNLRSILVVSEVAFALVLLTGSSLVLKSFWHLLQVNTGFNPENVVTANVDLPPIRYQKPYQQAQFAESLVEHLTRLPDVRQAAISSGLPFKDAPDAGIRIDGRPLGASDSGTTANYYRVTPQYFRSMEIPLLQGRFFNEQDTAKNLPVVVINETMAKRFFPSENPIGKRIDISGPTYLRQIVGVAGDVKQTGLKAAISPQVYEPFAQKPSSSFSVIVRGPNSESVAAAIREQVSALDTELPVSKVTTMKETVASSMSGDKYAAILLGIFSSLALMLAAVGIYGVIAYSVLQRMQEFGIRMAIGAGRGDILGIVFRHGLLLTTTGMLVGIGGALFLTRLLTHLLFQVSPFDVTSFASSVVLLGAISVVAFLIPAVRAARLNPMNVLRGE